MTQQPQSEPRPPDPPQDKPPNKKSVRARKHQPKGVEILFEDRDLIVVNKEAGLLTMGTGREGERTAYAALTDYVKKGEPKSRSRIFIVHRLDRGTSGLLVFAKNEAAKRALQDNWDGVEKIYWALVEGTPKEPEGMISSYLAENSAMRVYSTPDTRKGKLARTRYRTLKPMGKRTLLEISPLTGRKNQIRVHLADRGWPVVGDGKYGLGSKGSVRHALHAKKLAFTHPHSGERMTFEAPLPPAFYTIGGNRGGKRR